MDSRWRPEGERSITYPGVFFSSSDYMEPLLPPPFCLFRRCLSSIAAVVVVFVSSKIPSPAPAARASHLIVIQPRLSAIYAEITPLIFFFFFFCVRRSQSPFPPHLQVGSFFYLNDIALWGYISPQSSLSLLLNCSGVRAEETK